MVLIQAQRKKILELVQENVQLTAAVNQLQQQLAAMEREANPLVEVELDPDAREYIKDVTDQVVGAEMDPRAEITS
jgi:cell division protein FtsB